MYVTHLREFKTILIGARYIESTQVDQSLHYLGPTVAGHAQPMQHVDPGGAGGFRQTIVDYRDCRRGQRSD